MLMVAQVKNEHARGDTSIVGGTYSVKHGQSSAMSVGSGARGWIGRKSQGVGSWSAAG